MDLRKINQNDQKSLNHKAGSPLLANLKVCLAVVLLDLYSIVSSCLWQHFLTKMK